MGNLARPERTCLLDYRSFLETGERGELDVTETLEAMIEQGRGGDPTEALRFLAHVERDARVLLLLDMSLSMKGEKIALLAVASAVVLLSLPAEQLALMAFDSGPHWIKRFGERATAESLAERVLEFPTGGFTNIERALKEALSAISDSGRSGVKTHVILIGDGRYTEGRDPAELGYSFKRLSALRIGKDPSGRPLLIELSRHGGGGYFEARQAQDLPVVLYQALRTLVR